MSSISQMERSSSQMRILGMRALRFGVLRQRCRNLCRPSSDEFFCSLSHSQDKRASLAGLRPDPHFAFVCLHDLVNDCKAQASAAFELRLEWLKDFFNHLRTHSRARISKTELPFIAEFFNTYGQGATLLHGTNRIFAKIPEHLLHAVTISQGESFRRGIAALDVYSELLHFEPLFQ